MMSTTVIIIAGAVASYSMTCWALMDVATKDFGSLGKKAFWGAVAFIPFVGWVVYLLWGRKKGNRPEEAETETVAER